MHHILLSCPKWQPGWPAGGTKGKQTQREALQGGPDIVIGTPGRLSELMQAGSLRMECCQALVLDEVDILTGEASLFREQVHRREIVICHNLTPRASNPKACLGNESDMCLICRWHPFFRQEAPICEQFW